MIMPESDPGMRAIEVGDLVVLHCTGPREKQWGVLVRIDALGVVLRGLELESVEDWLAQERSGADPLIAVSTFLVPTHRVVRVDLDESGPMVKGYGDRYREECGRDVRDALFGRIEPGGAN
jgi:hypothetical protein